jgi:hypothetical protein
LLIPSFPYTGAVRVVYEQSQNEWVDKNGSNRKDTVLRIWGIDPLPLYNKNNTENSSNDTEDDGYDESPYDSKNGDVDDDIPF